MDMRHRAAAAAPAQCASLEASLLFYRRLRPNTAMDFDQLDLRLFQAIARMSNITRAAESQHLSLPAASARVRALEEHAGVALLQREARGVSLTPAGEAFLHHARAI